MEEHMKKQHKKEMLTRKQNEAKEAEKHLELEWKWKQEKRKKGQEAEMQGSQKKTKKAEA